MVHGTLKKGDTFETWHDVKCAIIEHGVSTERVITTYKKDSLRFLGKCKMWWHENLRQKCPWSIRVIMSSKTETITITQLNDHHSCCAADHYTRRMHNSADYLATLIFDILIKNRQTRACSLRDTAQAIWHPDVRYHTAHAAKKKALVRLDGDKRDSFHLIPSHCHHILERDPGAVAKYSASDECFETLFVCPSASRNAFPHCRPLIALDGTHTKSAYPQMLLVATVLDANNTVMILSYCMVPSENEQYWQMFLNMLHDAIPDLSAFGIVFISDREKGLQNAVDDVFPRAFHAFCTWHLGKNLQAHSNKAARKAFDGLVYAATEDQYLRRLDCIEEQYPSAHEYITKTAYPAHYSRAFMPFPRWGHETSQQAESTNRALKPERQEVAFKQSNLIWDYMMKHYFEKRVLAESLSTPFPPNIMGLLRDRHDEAFHLVADPSSPTEVRVTDSKGRHFLVSFDPVKECSCGDWQDVGIPCIHAWRAMTRLHLRHYDFVSAFYSSASFRRMYSGSIPAILKDNLDPDKWCGPPLKRRKRGHPTEKPRLRFSEEDGVRLPRACGFCKERGHDKRTCQLRKHQLGLGQGKEVHDNSSRDSDCVVSCDDDQENQDVVDIQQSAPFMEDSTDCGPSLTCPFEMSSFTALLASCSPGFTLQP